MNRTRLCCAAFALATGVASAVTPRIAVRDGQFVVRTTGERFTPLGANYYRVGEMANGKSVHAAFCPGFYDRAYVERMMADLSARGCNTVRTFHAYHVGEQGILTSPEARELAPGYLANVVHFLHQAREHRIYVIFTWDIWNPTSQWWSSQPLPDEERSSLLLTASRELLVNNVRFALPWARTRANAIVSLIEALRRADPDLLAVVLAWELENEAYFRVDQAPLAEPAGSFTFGGRDYRPDQPAEAQALMDAATEEWVRLCSGAIRAADPDTLVSCGLFTFRAVGRGGPGTLGEDQTADVRVPSRPLALLRGGPDYLDLHLYAWRTAEEGVTPFLERQLASVEWPTLQAAAREAGKPILVGETGVFANYLRRAPNWQHINHELGLECLREQLRGLRDRGFAGALYWHYGNPDTDANHEHPVLELFPQYGQALCEAFGSR